MSLNTPDHFDLFARQFLNTAGADVKRNFTLLGQVTIPFNNDEISYSINCVMDIPGQESTETKKIHTKLELSYYGGSNIRKDVPYKGPLPPARLAVCRGEYILFYEIKSELLNGKLRFRVDSLDDPTNNMLFTAKETHFPDLLASMVRKDLARVTETKLSSMIQPMGVIEQTAESQEALLESLPAGLNHWIPGAHLVPLTAAIQRAVKTNTCLWLNQSRDYGCRTMYINIRVDQRNGNFIVSGDTSPKVTMDGEAPDHMYPQGWAGCKHSPGLLRMVLDMNEAISQKVTREQVHTQIAIAEDAIRDMISRYSLNVSTKKTISPEQLMKYYGKKA